MWCSADCKRIYLSNVNRRPKVRWNCKVCGDLVVRDSGPKGIHCKRHRYNNPRQRAAQKQREAIKRSTAHDSESIEAQAIYERDHWRCGLCHTAVDKTLNHPHPMSASLDHIVPLSLGGHHVRTNVQLAHLQCNLRKGNRGHAQQLMLIG